MAKRRGKKSRRRRKSVQQARNSVTAVRICESGRSNGLVSRAPIIFVPEPRPVFNPLDWEGKEGDIGRYITEETTKILNAYVADPDGLDEDAQAERFSFRGGYSRRQLVELVQNSADALKRIGGRIEVRLTDDYLYCADEGAPITEGGVRSLMRSHLSSKHGTEFIGQFGLGFKSVLAISDAPEFFSRSGSFVFDRSRAERKIRDRIPGERPCPVLRLPEPINPIECADTENVLRDLMSWATNIVRLPLKSDAYARIKPQLNEFEPECLFFMAGVSHLGLKDDCDGLHEEHSTRNRGKETLLETTGSEATNIESRWRVFSTRAALSDTAREDYQTDIDADDEIDVSWAVPIERMNQPGDFWAYFPTTQSCLVAGIVNTRWKTNEDRHDLLEGPYNDELIELVAQLIAENIVILSHADDPSRHLDALPRRIETGDNHYADRLRTLVFQHLNKEPVLPDLLGELRRPATISYPPNLRDNTKLRDVYQSWIANNRCSPHWIHPSALRTRERIGTVERLCDNNGLPVNQGGLGAPRASVAEWLEVLVAGTADDEAIKASKAAIQIAVDLPRFEVQRELRGYGEIILTQDGDFASPKGDLYLPTEEGTNWPGRKSVHHALANNPSIRRKLLELGVQEASAETRFESLLNRTIPESWYGTYEVENDDFASFWTLSRKLDVDWVATKIINRSQWESRLFLMTRSGNWRTANSVLLPGDVVSSDDSRDATVTVDTAFHREDSPLLIALGISDKPREGWDLRGEPEFNSYLMKCIGQFQDRERKNYGGRPQPRLIDIARPSGAGPLNVFSLLSDEGKVRFTNALISKTAPFEAWVVAHKDRRKYDTMDVPQLAIPALEKHGRIQTSKGIVPITDALGERPVNREAQRWLLDHPNVKLIRAIFDLHDLPQTRRIAINGDSPARLVESWPGLERHLDASNRNLNLIRCQFIVDEYGDILEISSAVHGSDLLVTRLDREDELRAIGSELNVLQDEGELYDVLNQPTDEEIQTSRARVRAQHDDASRLLEAVGKYALQEGLPATLVDYYRIEYGSFSGLDAAKAAISTYHTGALRHYRRKIARLGPPPQWSGSSKAIEFVTELGFPPEWAGERNTRREPFMEVPGPIKLPDLHDYQQIIASKLRQMLRNRRNVADERRGMISLPTGAGKTRVAVEGIVNAMVEDEFNGGVLWVADRDELCEQAVESWQEVWRAFGTQDQILRISRMWAGQPPPEPTSERHVVVASIQTLASKLSRNSSEYDFLANFQLVVFDEAHRSIATTFTSALQELGFTHRLGPTEPYLLGLTATPYRGYNEAETHWLARRYGQNRLDRGAFWSDNADDVMRELQDMQVLARADHQEIDGTEYTLSTHQIQQIQNSPWLPDDVQDSLARDTERTRRIVKAYKDQVASKTETWPTLIFATSVEHAQTLAAILSADGISARAVSGGTDRYTRRQVVEQFRAGDLNVLVNYGVFREGFDAPKTRAIIVARPVYSPNLYFQMIGRGLRGIKNGGNDRCLILDVNDNIVNFERNLAFTELDWLWD